MCSILDAFGLSLQPGPQATGLSGGGGGSDAEDEAEVAGTEVLTAGDKTGAKGDRREAGDLELS